jgi:prophage maintenance system killer protein
MSETPRDPFHSQLTKLDIAAAETLDWAQTDAEATATKVRLLTRIASYFNVLSLTDFGGRLAPARDPRLVEQVIGAAFQTFSGQDPHPTPFAKAAMLLRGITQGHPFNDANKRTGFLTAAYYLEQMGFPLPETASPDTVVALCLAVSRGDVTDVADIRRELERIWEWEKGDNDNENPDSAH